MELGLGCVAHVLRAVWASGLSGCFGEGGGDDPGFFAMAAMVARSSRSTATLPLTHFALFCLCALS